MDHHLFLQGLSQADKRTLTRRANVHGIAQCLVHAGLLGVLMVIIVWQWTGWPLLMLPLGVLLVFVFCALHEATHGTVFKAKWANQGLAMVAGLLILIGPTGFRYFHFAHHRHTQDPLRDPELQSKKPKTRREYAIHISGWPLWRSLIGQLISSAVLGRPGDWVPSSAKGRVIVEARIMSLIYLVLALASVASGSTLLLWIWVIPLVLGQPFLRLFLLAEHNECKHNGNMLENTRTTLSTALLRRLVWNMSYHGEHHTMPTVPFHALPRLHGQLKAHVLNTEAGYVRYHQGLLQRLSGQ